MIARLTGGMSTAVRLADADTLVLHKRNVLAITGLVVSALIVAAFGFVHLDRAHAGNAIWIPVVIALMLLPYLIRGVREGFSTRRFEFRKTADQVIIDGHPAGRLSDIVAIELAPCNASCEEFNLFIALAGGGRHLVSGDATRGNVTPVAERLSGFLDLPVTWLPGVPAHDGRR